MGIYKFEERFLVIVFDLGEGMCSEVTHCVRLGGELGPGGEGRVKGRRFSLSNTDILGCGLETIASLILLVSKAESAALTTRNRGRARAILNMQAYFVVP